MPQAGSQIVIARLGPHHLDDRLDQRPRREVLARARLDVLGVLLEQPLVGVALDVGVERQPALAVDQVDDQPAQLGRVLDPVLRLAEDDAEHPRLAPLGLNWAYCFAENVGRIRPTCRSASRTGW